MRVLSQIGIVMILFGVSAVSYSALASQSQAPEAQGEEKLTSGERAAGEAAPTPTPTPPPAASVTPVPVNVIYVKENQPVQIMDSHGRLIQVIYLRKAKN